MSIAIRVHEAIERIHVKTPLNTFVEAFDWYSGQYVVVPVAQAVAVASGYDLK